jgi:16S rRNA (cytidine1402-2'-O)-methyltransferase
MSEEKLSENQKLELVNELLSIKKEMVSIHQHSSDEKIGFIIRELEAGRSVAYVSDNGTPGISDPGNLLIKAIIFMSIYWLIKHFYLSRK